MLHKTANNVNKRKVLKMHEFKSKVTLDYERAAIIC